MVLDSVVCLCVLIFWVTAGQLPAVVEADKEWGFFCMCMCVFFLLSSIESSFFVLPLSRERLDID